MHFDHSLRGSLVAAFSEAPQMAQIRSKYLQRQPPILAQTKYQQLSMPILKLPLVWTFSGAQEHHARGPSRIWALWINKEYLLFHQTPVVVALARVGMARFSTGPECYRE